MNEIGDCEQITPDVLVSRARAFHAEGCRLVQICATTLPDALELTYSFELDAHLRNLRLLVPHPGAVVPSISQVFWCAFIYENELHDLFGLDVQGMAVDFHGKFYTTAVKFPFGSTKPPVGPPPSPPAGARANQGAIKTGGNGNGNGDGNGNGQTAASSGDAPSVAALSAN